MDKEFKIIQTKEREEISNDFKSKDIINLTKYFGSSSIGKSITLIGALKYDLDHFLFGSLYVNCKIIEYYYYNNNPIIKKNILIEVIIINVIIYSHIY